jgi:hypothetical protein
MAARIANPSLNSGMVSKPTHSTARQVASSRAKIRRRERWKSVRAEIDASRSRDVGKVESSWDDEADGKVGALVAVDEDDHADGPNGGG